MYRWRIAGFVLLMGGVVGGQTLDVSHDDPLPDVEVALAKAGTASIGYAEREVATARETLTGIRAATVIDGSWEQRAINQVKYLSEIKAEVQKLAQRCGRLAQVLDDASSRYRALGKYYANLAGKPAEGKKSSGNHYRDLEAECERQATLASKRAERLQSGDLQTLSKELDGHLELAGHLIEAVQAIPGPTVETKIANLETVDAELLKKIMDLAATLLSDKEPPKTIWKKSSKGFTDKGAPQMMADLIGRDQKTAETPTITASAASERAADRREHKLPDTLEQPVRFDSSQSISPSRTELLGIWNTHRGDRYELRANGQFLLSADDVLQSRGAWSYDENTGVISLRYHNGGYYERTQVSWSAKPGSIVGLVQATNLPGLSEGTVIHTSR